MQKIYNIFLLFTHSFLTIGVRDVLDILFVAAIVYLIFIFIKQTRLYFVFNSFLFILVIVYLSRVFNLTLTRQLFQPLLTFFIVIFVVVFQREIRRFFDWFSLGSKNLSMFREMKLSSEVSSSIVKAVEIMARERTGAIIVIPGEYPLEDLLEGGSPLDGKVSTSLLLSIFDTGSPGHDGAVLIQNNLIRKFGLHLPLAEDFNRYGEFGTRHRAAAGVTEHSDCLAIVVSEERGTISLAEGGILTKVLNGEELEEKIKIFLKENIIETNPSVWHYVFVRHLFAKIFALILAVALWFFFVYQTGVVTQVFTVPVEIRFLPKQYTLQGVSPAEISVSFSGKNSDFSSLDTSLIKGVVDGSDFVAGRNRVVLESSEISHPAYLDLVKISPETVTVVTTQTESEVKK